MKTVDAKNRKKQTKLIIILASVVLFLILASIATKLIIDNLGNDDPVTPTPPQTLEGEGLLNDFFLLAYPQVQTGDMTYIEVTTPDGKYGLERDEETGDMYILHTPEGEDELKIYLPPIVNAEGSFDYSSLFAVAEGDNYGITNVYYLCSVIGTLYFDERIPVPTDAEEKASLYRYYGFTQDNAKLIGFTYKDSEGVERAHTITIGDKMITGSGYYYMIDNRPYIYVTTSSYLDYALGGAASLINSMLVSKGLVTDSYLEPYLTPEYKQWKTTLHDNAGDTVKSGSTVIVTAEILSPQNPTSSAKPEDFVTGGYLGVGFGKTEFDLTKFTDEKYAAMLDSLVGAAVGSYSGEEIVFTAIGSSLAANIPDGEDSVTYAYKVTAIEAILDGGEISAVGTSVGSNKLLKVTYTATVGGKSVTPTAYHAVIDLDNALIPNEAKAAFAVAAVGELSSPIEFSVTYSKSDAENQTVSKLIITEIHDVYDSTGKLVETVGEDCIVTYSYVIKVGSKTSETYQGYVDLSDDDESASVTRLAELLIGKSVGSGLSIVVETYIEYPQIMADFDTVRIKEIHGFVTSELVVSFRFVNEEFRDPFYGESIYENTLNTSNRNYGLNNTVCQTVVSILGGIGDNSTSTDGFVGVETVAVGLNADTMLEYGLYAERAHRIRFVLPRNVVDTGEEDTVFYEWTSTLAFNLYISEENEDGTRYVASDMYDVVAKVKSSELVFLNYDFLDFWARRSPMLLDVEEITSLKLNLNMPNVHGEYKFDVTHTDYYYDVNGNRYATPGTGRTHDTFMELMVTEAPGSMQTALSKYIEANGIVGAVDFSKFFGGGKDKWVEYDTTDVNCFKEVLHILYMTSYVGRLSEDEKTDAYTFEPLMSIELTLRGNTDRYVYEFRRFDDRRVMVTVKCCDLNGSVRYESSDFYISTSVTREIVTGFVYLLNGMEVDNENLYEDLPEILD